MNALWFSSRQVARLPVKTNPLFSSRRLGSSAAPRLQANTLSSHTLIKTTTRHFPTKTSAVAAGTSTLKNQLHSGTRTLHNAIASIRSKSIPCIRQYSTGQSSPTTPSTPKTLYARVLSRLPKRMRPYVERNLKISHITSFLILHELSAIVPLAGLFWVIHSLGPEVMTSKIWFEAGEDGVIAQGISQFNSWVDNAVWRFGRYAERKGYLSNMDAAAAGRIVTELAVAYAIVKAVLPLRIMASLWATPWFARVVLGGGGRILWKLVGKKKTP
ncbi:hypothetical protein DFH27DRAFT_88180 [Peziza echinospora]|nr:hypothetical protein DFH27DRAFT_88180 [Peziza echinospora]